MSPHTQVAHLIMTWQEGMSAAGTIFQSVRAFEERAVQRGCHECLSPVVVSTTAAEIGVPVCRRKINLDDRWRSPHIRLTTGPLQRRRWQRDCWCSRLETGVGVTKATPNPKAATTEPPAVDVSGESDRWLSLGWAGDPVSRAMPGLMMQDRPAGHSPTSDHQMREPCPSCDGAWAVAPIRSDFVEGRPGETSHIVHHWRCTGCGREWKTAVQVSFGES